MPFPWTRDTETLKVTASEKVFTEGTDPKVKRQKLNSNSVDLTSMPWFSQLVLPCQPLGCIDFNVPKPESTAGSVLKHSQRVVESLLRHHGPCTYKVTWTHNPAWRWANDIYGYHRDRDRWQKIIVFYVSQEPAGPAMLEAALVDQHMGDSPSLKDETILVSKCFKILRRLLCIELIVGVVTING